MILSVYERNSDYPLFSSVIKIIPGYPERTGVVGYVEAVPTAVFFSYLSLPDKRKIILKPLDARQTLGKVYVKF